MGSTARYIISGFTESERNLQMATSMFTLVPKHLISLRESYDCCVDLETSYDEYHDVYSLIIKKYNDMLKMSKSGAGTGSIKDVEMARLIKLSKQLFDDLITFDKAISDRETELRENSDKTIQKRAIQIYNLPIAPTGKIYKGGKKGKSRRKSTATPKRRRGQSRRR